jgi:hypothetical protein
LLFLVGIYFFSKRIGIAQFTAPPAFRTAWQLAPIGAIFHRPIHSSAIVTANAEQKKMPSCLLGIDDNDSII